MGDTPGVVPVGWKRIGADFFRNPAYWAGSGLDLLANLYVHGCGEIIYQESNPYTDGHLVMVHDRWCEFPRREGVFLEDSDS